MCGSTSSLVHRSHAPEGPWLPLPSIPHTACNNPAPAFAKNGTLYVLCSSSSIWRTEEPTSAAAWQSVSRIDLNDSPWTVGGPEYLRVEDPYLYQDKNENWHLLVHLYDYRDGYPVNPNQTMPVLVSGRAANSWGPWDPTGPLGTPSRTPWTLSRYGTCHRRRPSTIDSARTSGPTVGPTAAELLLQVFITAGLRARLLHGPADAPLFRRGGGVPRRGSGEKDAKLSLAHPLLHTKFS